MRFCTVEAARSRDRSAIESGADEYGLMLRAGKGLATFIKLLMTARGSDYCVVVVGSGNNGGDGLVAARLLEDWGVRCKLFLTKPPPAFKGSALKAWEAYYEASSSGRRFEVLDNESLWSDSVTAPSLPPNAVIVDALLGTGSKGAPHGVVRSAIEWIGKMAVSGACVVAVDIPSGLDGDTGELSAVVEITARATMTVSFDRPKTGFLNPAAWRYIGRVEVVDIGIADNLEDQLRGRPELELLRGDSDSMPRRQPNTHKGHYGRVLIVGGSKGLEGAPALAAMGALRTGGGLVSAVVPESAAPVFGQLAEVMGSYVADELDWKSLLDRHPELAAFDAIVAGPGMGKSRVGADLVKGLLASDCQRLVLDADALNLLALERPFKMRRNYGELVITPHPGEAARLLDTSVEAVQRDRAAAAKELVAQTGAVVVLKGAGTLVAAAGGNIEVSLAGNPGMATGGSGDVLAGMIGALWGQGRGAFEAARLGIYLHALAGDIAAWNKGEEFLKAGDIVANIGAAISYMRSAYSEV